MQELHTPTPDEENQIRISEIKTEIEADYRKANQFPKSIIGRKRLRALRQALWEIGIHVPIPMNSAQITNEYCKKYGKEESDKWSRGVF